MNLTDRESSILYSALQLHIMDYKAKSYTIPQEKYDLLIKLEHMMQELRSK